MEINTFKELMYNVLDDNDVALEIADIDTHDKENLFVVRENDGSVFEIEIRKIE